MPALPGAVYRPFVDIEPPLADQVTVVVDVPVTVALNCCVVFATSETVVGEMVTVTAGAVTVTVADADTAVFALLVAVTVYVPAVLGAVYEPLELMLPPVADHVTVVVVVPVTVAVNVCLPLSASVTDFGEMVIAMTGTTVSVSVAASLTPL